MPSFPTGRSPMTCDHTVRRSETLGSNTGMSAGDGRTTELRIRISRRGNGSARFSDSRAPAQRRNSCQPMPPSRILSTSNAISPQPKRIACFALRLWTHGGRRSQRPDCSLRRRIFALAAQQHDRAPLYPSGVQRFEWRRSRLLAEPRPIARDRAAKSAKMPCAHSLNRRARGNGTRGRAERVGRSDRQALPNLTVTLVNDYLEGRLAELNQQHLSDGAPWVLVQPSGRHCQTEFYTAGWRSGMRWSPTVFVHESPRCSARFDAENDLY